MSLLSVTWIQFLFISNDLEANSKYRKFLLGSATDSPKIALTITRYRAFKSPKQLPERIGWSPIAI